MLAARPRRRYAGASAQTGQRAFWRSLSRVGPSPRPGDTECASTGLPWGPAKGLDAKQLRFLERENDIVRRGLELMRLALSLGFEVIFEHPAKTNDKKLRFFNRRAKRCASIFDLDMLQEQTAEFGLLFVEFPQCALLGLTMKPTRLLYTRGLHALLAPLGSLDCEHRPGGHPGGQAYGRDKRGRSLSARTAAYPSAMAAVFVDCAEMAQGCLPHEIRLRPKHVVTARYPATSDDDSDDMPRLVSHSETSEEERDSCHTTASRRSVATRSDTEPSAGSGSASHGDTTDADDSPGLQMSEVTHPSGLASTGSRLGATVARAVHEARHTPPSFRVPQEHRSQRTRTSCSAGACVTTRRRRLT